MCLPRPSRLEELTSAHGLLSLVPQRAQEESFDTTTAKLSNLESKAIKTAEQLTQQHEEMKESSTLVLDLIASVKSGLDLLLGSPCKSPSP